MKKVLLVCALVCAGCASLPSDLRVARVTTDPDGVTERAELVFMQSRENYTVVEGDTFESQGERYTVSAILPGRVVVLKSLHNGKEYDVPALTPHEAMAHGILR